MFSSIKSKLTVSIFFLFITTIAIVIGIFWYDRQNTKLQILYKALSDTQIQLQEADKTQRDFFSFETINPDFYISKGKSKFLERHTQLTQKLKSNINSIKSSPFVEENEHLVAKLDSLTAQTNYYQSVFDSLVRLIYKKGFKDSGIVGQMRERIHDIEDAKSPPLPLAQVLMIRRHEKDFIIRKDTDYVIKLNDAVKVLENSLRSEVKKPQTRDLYLKWVEEYKNYFDEMVGLEFKIGYTNLSGLKGKINLISSQMNKSVEELEMQLEEKSNEEKRKMRVILAIIIVSGLITNAVLAGWVIQKMGRPIRKLSKSINSLAQDEFRGQNKTVVFKGKDEIGILSRDVQALLNALQAHTIKIEEKSVALLSQNAELEQQQEEILSQRNLLENQNKFITGKNVELEKQKQEISLQTQILQNQLQEIEIKNAVIDEKQTKIMDSITYAKRIQEAMLPDVRSIERAFSEAFVFFKPRDVVSGDLYFLHRSKEKTIIAVVDCTGHGVPGALMSMIAFNLLSTIVINEKPDDPAQLLELLHQGTVRTLKQKVTNNRDGMDAAVCIHHKAKNEVWFSGAKSKLIYIQEKRISTIKGSKLPIGGLLIQKERDFTTQRIKVSSPTQFYLFSDGYQDQFGGEKGRKFMGKNLQNLFYKINHLPAQIQYQQVESTFEKWKESQPQVDDVLVVGFRIE